MARIDFPFVKTYRDRHGRLRSYFRRGTAKPVALPGPQGSPEWIDAYRSARAMSDAAAPKHGESRTIPGSVDDVVAAYLDISAASTSVFRTLKPETQRSRRYILEGFRQKYGKLPLYRVDGRGKRIMLLTRPMVQQIVNAKASTPFAQRNLIISLHAVFDWAVGEGRLPENPAVGVTRVKKASQGWATWTEEQIGVYEATHPIGTTPRLALTLFLYTGARLEDVRGFGPHNIHKGEFTYTQQKNEGKATAPVVIPVHPKLAETIAATTLVGPRHFLLTSFGAPYTVKGLGNAMRNWADAAGCNGVSAHGLRKAAARRLAELGCSEHQIMAMTGHASVSELTKYTRAANRKQMGREAMAKLIESGK